MKADPLHVRRVCTHTSVCWLVCIKLRPVVFSHVYVLKANTSA